MTDAAPPPPPFFVGPIEAAIASSITRGLPLACFIADDGAESSTWQDEFMQDPEVLPLLSSRCVLLRLQAGSVEAGFLAAFCPIQAVPYLVVVKNGQMVANIAAGATRDEFTAGIRTALPETETPEAPAAVPAAAAPVTTPQPAAAASVAPTPPPPSTSPAPPSARRDSTTPAARRGSTTPVPSSSRRESSAGHLAYLEQQRKRQLAAAEDRKRVLQLLENDKIERRQRASTTSTSSAAPAPAARQTTPPPARATPSETALSLRLLDGSSLKSRFASTATLATDVRPWIDEHRTDNSDHPYSFLQILAPSPNKQLSLSDERSTLLELGLAPTATLVLVPAQSYVSAYTGGGASSEVGLLGRAYGLIYGAVATVLGVGYPAARAAAPAPPPPPQQQQQQQPSGATLGRAGRSEVRETQSVSRASSASGRIRTLYDAAEEPGKEPPARKYYNGNQLDFEPERDEKGKERKE